MACRRANRVACRMAYCHTGALCQASRVALRQACRMARRCSCCQSVRQTSSVPTCMPLRQAIGISCRRTKRIAEAVRRAIRRTVRYAIRDAMRVSVCPALAIGTGNTLPLRTPFCICFRASDTVRARYALCIRRAMRRAIAFRTGYAIRICKGMAVGISGSVRSRICLRNTICRTLRHALRISHIVRLRLTVTKRAREIVRCSLRYAERFACRICHALRRSCRIAKIASKNHGDRNTCIVRDISRILRFVLGKLSRDTARPSKNVAM